MKKILGLVLLLALFVPAVAQAKINLYGQLDIMGSDLQYDEMGPAFVNERSFTNTRFLLGANFGLEKNIKANVALLYTNSWGNDYLAGQQIDSSSDRGVLNVIRIAEANVIFKNLFDNDRFTLKLGKFFYGEKGDSIFYLGLRDMSQLGYAYSNLYGYSTYDTGMDGAQLTYDTRNKFKIDLVYSKISNESNTETGNTKSNMVIIDAKYKFNDNIKVKGYLYDSETTDLAMIGYGNRSEIIGIKPEVSFGKLNASAEIAQEYVSYKSQLFDDTPTDGILTRVNASYLIDLSKNMTLLPKAQYLRFGDNFYSRLADVNFGLISSSRYWYWSGIYDVESYNIGADWTISKYKISADYFKDSYADGSDQWYELDVLAEYNYTKQVKFYAGYAYTGDQEDGNWYYTEAIFGASYKF